MWPRAENVQVNPSMMTLRRITSFTMVANVSDNPCITKSQKYRVGLICKPFANASHALCNDFYSLRLKPRLKNRNRHTRVALGLGGSSRAVC